MSEPILIQGLELSQANIQEIRDLIASKSKGTRWTISREICTRWNWRTLTGRLKDMACRTMLNKLAERGLISLPPKGRRPLRRPPTPIVVDTRSLRCRLEDLKPLHVEIVTARSHEAHLLHSLLSTYHYLGFKTFVGETIAYIVRDRYSRVVACSVFGAAAWKTAPRDEYIGWNAALRSRGLEKIANNHRYLILPWVNVPHLASHVLGIIARRIRADWTAKYGRPIALLETFVDRDRFRGTCYRAANWRCVGQTQGRSRQDRYSKMNVPVKDIYLYPLSPTFREELSR